MASLSLRLTSIILVILACGSYHIVPGRPIGCETKVSVAETCLEANEVLKKAELETIGPINGFDEHDRKGTPEEVIWHCNAITNGSFQLEDINHPDRIYVQNNEYLPYHIGRLIEIGEDASPCVFDRLRSQIPTRSHYFDHLVFKRQGSSPKELRIATVSDIADYILEHIYSTDVGYRSYLPQAERQAAIERWRKIVEEGKSKGATTTAPSTTSHPATRCAR